MRIHNWFRTIAGTLALTAAAESAVAQDFGPGGQMMAPGSGPVDPGVMYPQGVPQGFNPWPQVSPYGAGNMDQDQYRHRNGLWFEEILNKDREFYGGVDAIWADLGVTNGSIVSSPYIPYDQATHATTVYNPPTYGVGLPVAGGREIGTGANPWVYMRPNGQLNYVAQPYDFIFPIHSTGVMPNETNAGLEARWGFDDADGMGMMLSGFYLAPKTQLFQRGTDVINGVPVTPDMVTRTAGQILYTKNGSIAYSNGTPDLGDDPIGVNGGAQKYDIMYRLANRIDAAGANVAMYMSPLVKTSGVMVRPFLAGRYMYINENFAFKGVDSGFNYDVDEYDYGGVADIPDDPSTFRPDGRLIQRYDQFTATLQNTIQSHIAGPEVGFRYDLGRRKSFTIWGATTFGLMANYASMNLSGNNIGEVLITSELFGFDMLANDARFADKKTTSHVSPLFEQSIVLEARVFEELPYLSEIPILNEAMLRFGYTFTAIGKVNRADDTINWRGFPLFPDLNTDTQTFVMNRINLGLEWTW
jgi:hypothetical protein